MHRSIRAALLGLLVQATPAAALDPEQAGREARDDLRELLDKQRRDREERNADPKPEPPKPASKQGTKDPAGAIGGDLPTICVGCDAK